MAGRADTAAATAASSSDSNNTANATGGVGGTGGQRRATAELAATPARSQPPAQPMALALVTPPQLAQAAQAAGQQNRRDGRRRRQCHVKCNSDQRPQRCSLIQCQWRQRLAAPTIFWRNRWRVGVTRTPRQPVLLANRPQSLPPP